MTDFESKEQEAYYEEQFYRDRFEDLNKPLLKTDDVLDYFVNGVLEKHDGMKGDKADEFKDWLKNLVREAYEAGWSDRDYVAINLNASSHLPSALYRADEIIARELDEDSVNNAHTDNKPF